MAHIRGGFTQRCDHGITQYDSNGSQLVKHNEKKNALAKAKRCDLCKSSHPVFKTYIRHPHLSIPLNITIDNKT